MDIDTFENIIRVTMGIKDETKEKPELVMCSNCNEFVPDDYGKYTEHDGFLCEQCLTDGYGQ